jgi:hypothetical protein
VICAFLSFVVSEGELSASRIDPFTLWEKLPLFIKSRVVWTPEADLKL